MQPHKKTTRKVVGLKKLSLKRRFASCKKLKGPHQFVLTVPWFVYEKINEGEYKTPQDYYDFWDKKHEESVKKGGWSRRVRWWVCAACGHKDVDSEESPSRKIRDNLKPPEGGDKQRSPKLERRPSPSEES